MVGVVSSLISHLSSLPTSSLRSPSGTGRVVLSASALWGVDTWRVCRGVELAPALDALAREAHAKATASGYLRSDVDLQRGSWDEAALDDVDLAFAFSTAFELDSEGRLSRCAVCVCVCAAEGPHRPISSLAP